MLSSFKHKSSDVCSASMEGSVLFLFLCLCFHLHPVPRMFAKLLKDPIAMLRKMIVQLTVFFHDILIITASIEDWQWLETV